jgi:hypothetical protein
MTWVRDPANHLRIGGRRWLIPLTAAGLRFFLADGTSATPVPASRRRGVPLRGRRWAITWRIAATIVAPCPRRDAGPVRPGRGIIGQHLSDRGQAADDTSVAIITTVAPCPRRDAGAFVR